MSLFITFEGGEGSGKSTQANLLFERLRKQKKWGVVYVEEPGTTLIGKQVREWLKGEGNPLVVIPGSGTQLDLFGVENGKHLPQLKVHPTSPREELLAFSMARSQLVQEQIIPNQKGKTIIISNRFADSTTAYQGYGRELDLKLVKMANEIATQGIKPDLTFLLDIAPEQGLIRKFGATRNQFEKEQLEFHKRVREGYCEIAKEEPERWFVMDATKSKDEIAEMIWQKVRQLIKDREPEPEY